MGVLQVRFLSESVIEDIKEKREVESTVAGKQWP